MSAAERFAVRICSMLYVLAALALLGESTVLRGRA